MTVRDAVEHARDGATVVIVGPDALRRVDEATALALASNETVSILRANGREKISFRKGGQLTFHRDTPSIRGLDIDVAYITSLDAIAWAEALRPAFGMRPHRIGVLLACTAPTEPVKYLP